jgi:tetratricopeptide (TPR) repeat protein
VDFVAVVDQVIALLRQRGRVAYRTLKRQFQLERRSRTSRLSSSTVSVSPPMSRGRCWSGLALGRYLLRRLLASQARSARGPHWPTPRPISQRKSSPRAQRWKASALAEQLLALSRTHPGRGYQAQAFRLLGDIARHRDPPQSEPAAAHYQQALGLAEALGMRPLAAHCHRGLGLLYCQSGRGEQARAALSAAIELYRAMDMTFWLPQAEAALAQVEGS